MMLALPTAIAAIIDAAAVKHGLAPSLLRAVCWVESRGDPWSEHPRTHARGLLQLMPKTAKDLGVTDPFNPRQNAEGGARFLANLIRRFGSVERALWAYNWGPARVASNRTPPLQVRHYATNVLTRQAVEESGTLVARKGDDSHHPLSPSPSSAPSSCLQGGDSKQA